MTVDFSAAGEPASAHSATVGGDESSNVFGVEALAGRADSFSARWVGMLQAAGPSEAYRFRLSTDGMLGKQQGFLACSATASTAVAAAAEAAGTTTASLLRGNGSGQQSPYADCSAAVAFYAFWCTRCTPS